MNTPNKLTMFRIFLIPVIVLVYLIPTLGLNITLPIYQVNGVNIGLVELVVVLLFMLASITDFIDGYLARRDNLITTFGKFMDPIADKLLVNTLLILLTFNHQIPVLATIIMIARDTIVDAVRFLAAQKQVVIAAGPLGKAKTFIQMFAIIFVLLNNLPFEWINLPVSIVLIYLATLISFISGFDYVYKNKDLILESI